jgi:hypothetical protein
MSWTSHDQFFGWIHSFKFNRNNYIFGGKSGLNDKPYPVIITEPSISQVVSNWNRADTGLVISSFLIGLLVARRIVVRTGVYENIIDRRQDFKQIHRIILFFGTAFALRNSCYRLEGYVPNGLPRTPVDDVVKYDFTTKIINSTFWQYLFENQAKPTNL